MEMVPLRFVRAVWSGPVSNLVFVDDDEALLLSRPSLICCKMASTESDGPSWQYWRTEASLALRRKTPMAWREVLVDDCGDAC